MNEKTCGTCAHAIAVMHPCDEFNAKVDDGTFHQTMLCDDWTERTDSVERIAFDMWDTIRDYAPDVGEREGYARRLREQVLEVTE